MDENFKLKHYSKLQHYGTGWLSMANTGCITETVNPLQATKGDYINWPRRQRPIDKPPVRLRMFTALHSKTGAIGSYMVGFGTWMASKEIYVFEHVEAMADLGSRKFSALCLEFGSILYSISL